MLPPTASASLASPHALYGDCVIKYLAWATLVQQKHVLSVALALTTREDVSHRVRYTVFLFEPGLGPFPLELTTVI